MALLTLQNLTLRFGNTTVVEDVNLSIEAGETLALVGESGCGKSVTALSILRLLPAPGHIAAGQVLFENQELTALSEHQLDDLRGGEISVIWQDPLAALNPLLPVGVPIIEGLIRHKNLSKISARKVAVETLRRVGIPQ